MQEHIILLKFPPHVTDVLQQLDSCFSPVTRKWENLLNSQTIAYAIKNRVTKSELADLLCSTWYEDMKPINAKSGFESTDIYPVDCREYHVSRFDPRIFLKI